MDVGKIGGAAASVGVPRVARAPSVRPLPSPSVQVGRHAQLLARVASVPRHNPAQVRVVAGTLPNQLLDAVKTSNGPVALELKQYALDLGDAIKAGAVPPAAIAAAPPVHAAPVGAAAPANAPQVASPSELASVPTEDAVAQAIDMIDRALQSGTAMQLAAAVVSSG